MKIVSFLVPIALFATHVTAESDEEAEFDYDLELKWKSPSFAAKDCSSGDRTLVDTSIFDKVNAVLTSDKYQSFQDLEEEDDRRALRGNDERDLCNGTKMCSKYCRYNKKLCNKMYRCGCKKRALVTLPASLNKEQVERKLFVLKEQITNACMEGLADNAEESAKTSATCKRALGARNAMCKVKLMASEDSDDDGDEGDD